MDPTMILGSVGSLISLASGFMGGKEKQVTTGGQFVRSQANISWPWVAIGVGLVIGVGAAGMFAAKMANKKRSK